jgi:hypothetical protein
MVASMKKISSSTVASDISYQSKSLHFDIDEDEIAIISDSKADAFSKKLKTLCKEDDALLAIGKAKGMKHFQRGGNVNLAGVKNVTKFQNLDKL